jgi:hypothetical protein
MLRSVLLLAALACASAFSPSALPTRYDVQSGRTRRGRNGVRRARRRHRGGSAAASLPCAFRGIRARPRPRSGSRAC